MRENGQKQSKTRELCISVHAHHIKKASVFVGGHDRDVVKLHIKSIPRRKPKMEERVFATRLRTLRKERKLSQGELAEKTGISFDSISSWERGVRGIPRQSMLKRLSKFFDVSEEYLTGESDKRYDHGCSSPAFWISDDPKENDERHANLMCTLSEEGKMAAYAYIESIYFADKESGTIQDPGYKLKAVDKEQSR